MLELLVDPNVWIAFASLTAMEIVLGIDNIVFISVLVSRLPKVQADKARALGLTLALVFRIALLLVISWIIGLTQPALTIFGMEFSWKDIILLGGGVFLVYKATHEMHAEVEAPHEPDLAKQARGGFAAIIAQIVVIDMVFSIDSIVTAVGMADHVEVMVAAVVVAVGVMFVSSGPVAKFVSEHPTTKMLALAFLLLIGVTLVAEGLGLQIPKGYIYSAMAFSVLVESVNIVMTRRRKERAAAAGGAGSVAGHAAVAVAAAPATPKPRTKSTPAARAKSRPKSAPRKKS